MPILKKPKLVKCDYGGDYYVIPPFSFHKVITPNNRHIWQIFVCRPDDKFGHKMLGQYYVETGGYFVLELEPRAGYLNEYALKSLHDFLVFLNKPYDKELNRYFRWSWLRDLTLKLREIHGNNKRTAENSQEGGGEGIPQTGGA